MSCQNQTTLPQHTHTHDCVIHSQYRDFLADAQSCSNVQQLEDAVPLLQGFPGLVLLLLGGRALLLPGRHDAPEGLHHLVVRHADPLPQLLLPHLLPRQPAAQNMFKHAQQKGLQLVQGSSGEHLRKERRKGGKEGGKNEGGGLRILPQQSSG